MTINVRSDWLGNDAEATFTKVEDAVAYLEAKNPFYEIVPSERIRPFGDVEACAPEDCTEAEFNRIQTEMTYPGQVKVTVIRETRAVNYAK